MAKIISIEERRLLKTIRSELNVSISEILEQSRRAPDNNGSVAIGRYASLGEWLRDIIAKEIIQRQQLSEEIFLCGMYIAGMLANVDCDLKKYAVDYLENWSSSSDPKFLKMGGDFCFILCGGFAARCERRSMHLRDYQEMGVNFYDWFYSSTGKVIGHYMSVNFELMQQIANSILVRRPATETA